MTDEYSPAAVLAVPTAGVSADGTVLRDARGRILKGSPSPNLSDTGRIAKMAGVHRDTARKHSGDLRAEARFDRYMAVIAMLRRGCPRREIASTLHIGCHRISWLHRLLVAEDAKAINEHPDDEAPR